MHDDVSLEDAHRVLQSSLGCRPRCISGLARLESASAAVVAVLEHPTPRSFTSMPREGAVFVAGAIASVPLHHCAVFHRWTSGRGAVKTATAFSLLTILILEVIRTSYVVDEQGSAWKQSLRRRGGTRFVQAFGGVTLLATST